MMSPRKNTLSSMLLLAAAATMAVGISACSGDDDDDGNTPLPNPYDACYMFWDHYIDNPVTRGNRFLVAGLTETWTTGTLQLGTGEADGFAQMLYEITFGTGVEAAYISTNGSFDITAPSNSLHEPVAVSIGSAPTWVLSEGTGGNAVGGTGDADGFFNDGDDCFGNGDSEDCLIGTGDVSIAIGTTNLTIGESSTPGQGFTLGFCEDLTAFSGTWRERAEHLGRTLPPLGK